MWDLIVSVPDHCLSFTFPKCLLPKCLLCQNVYSQNIYCAKLSTPKMFTPKVDQDGFSGVAQKTPRDTPWRSFNCVL